MEIYLVGGAVRDQLLSYPIYDKDWVVVGATPEAMLELGYKPVGSDFPVFIHPTSNEEYALARTERKSGKGYTGFQYYASPEVTLEEDLSRRDLTINAMAQSKDGKIIDPYGGLDDLQAKLLRHVSPAFSEDPLRILRVARFAARYAHLGFTLAPETLQLMQNISASDELEHLTRERVWQELDRALAEKTPLVFFTTLDQANALTTLFPVFKKLVPSVTSAATATAATSLQQLFTDDTANEIRFAALCVLCFREEGFIEAADAKEALLNFCQQLRTPNQYRDLALHTLTALPVLHHWSTVSAEQRLTLIQALDLIRRPERLGSILQTCTLLISALYQERLNTQALESLLIKLKDISPAQIIQQGFKGAALGTEIKRQQLTMCENEPSIL
ncbi:CCA tRNA nucleotidyltransferase [Neptunomonas antarctica]|uniref:CCA-adding enzyme n=1 Tax=Neptunomonas antarctica TaxID=619304 RepID=A0A1N7JDU3_9GAMM|nr:CCA tRNA nucleotidyltransferase [Neptunomonas antarctica]SIS47426.1 tRNA nucleotidyltransferase (CCA-adding enzyme) [Neptunomonas antarctica]